MIQIIDKLRQRIERDAHNYAPYKTNPAVNICAANEGYIKCSESLLPVVEKLVEVCEFYSKRENLGKTVWEDGDRSGKCWVEPFDNYEINEIYGPFSSGDYGIKAEEALADLEKYASEGEG